MADYQGDISENATIYVYWNTNDSSGASITRATNGTISAYKDANVTQTTTGVTDTEDFDSLTGVHVITVDASDAFYATGTDIHLVLSAATIDGQTVNHAIASFSIENRHFPNVATTAAIADAVLDEALAGHVAAGSLGKAVADIESDATAILADTGELQTDWVNGGRLDLLIDAIKVVTDNLATFGLMSSGLDTQANVASATASTIVFDDAAMIGTNDYYKGMIVFVYGGTGAGQARYISAYVGASKTATVEPDWGTNPDATSDVVVLSGPGWPDVNVTQVGGTSQTAGDLAALITTLDTVADAIKAVTDNLPNSGALSDLAAILIDTAVIGALGAGLTNIPWNASWDAEVQSEVADALTAYDPPTKAEMDTAHALLATEAKQDVIDGIVDDILVDTGATLDGRIPAALVGGKMDSDVTAISGDSVAADRLESLMDGLIVAQVNDASATATAFAADGFTEATDDHFNGRLITFLTGALLGQQTDITSYDAAGGTQGAQEFTVTALTEAPGNNDFFVIH